MSFKANMTDLNDRLTAFAAQFDSQFKKHRPKKGSALETIFNNLHDLFTRGVTREGMLDLVRRDARDTLRFFTREVDFDSLRHLPWWKRIPSTIWHVFLAFAYRLSPPRRIVFAIACFIFFAGFLILVMLPKPPGNHETGSEMLSIALWYLIVGGLLMLLLLLMELRDKLDLKGDLEIAREIQLGLVPSQPYQKDGISIHYFVRPANTVGGDYHDLIALSPTEVAVVIGDVSGKGMPAALLMALLQGSLRTLITAGLRGPELVARLNDYLVDSIPANRLVTLFCGELNTSTGELRYVNAGHNPPFLLRRDSQLERLDPTTMVLGIAKGGSLEGKAAVLQPGDHLLLYTDGISEAFNDRDEEYGEGRVAEYLRRHAGEGQEILLQGLIRDATSFCGMSRPTDDITLVSVARSA